MIGFFRRYFGLRISNCFKCGKFGYFWSECCIYVRWKEVLEMIVFCFIVVFVE